jgi:threonine/homoserine/homoserine lactone efflux protein
MTAVMLQYLLFGGGFAFAAAVQPGPLQAFLLSRAAAEGWKRTLPASLSPLLSDGPIALLVLLVIGRLPVAAQRGLRVAGGVLLLYLAWAALRQRRSASTADQVVAGSGPRTLLQAAMVNLVNPNPYLGWALVLGPAAAAAWRRGPANAAVLIAGFYGVMVATLAAFILLVGSTRFLGSRGQRTLVLISAVVLAALGVFQLVAGLVQPSP